MGVVAVVPVVKRMKDNRVAASVNSRCALIVAPGISNALANNFARRHFHRPIDFYYIEQLAKNEVHIIGQTRPRAVNSRQVAEQQIYVLDLSGVEVINTINLFRQVQLKKNLPLQDVIMVHAFTPEEITGILQKGLDFFP